MPKQIKRFLIENGGSVTDAGFRAELVGRSVNHNIKVCAKNIGQDVQVVCEGEHEDIVNFREHIDNHKICPPLKKGKCDYTVGELENYTGNGIDMNYCTNSLVLEQISKFVPLGQGILDGQDKLIGLQESMSKDISNMSKDIANMALAFQDISSALKKKK